MGRKPHSSRNKWLGRGIERYSRSAMYSRSGKWAVKNKKPIPKPKVEKKEVTKKFGKKGETRVIVPRIPRSYPSHPTKKPLHSRKHIHRPTTLRASIKPGCVLIILSGRFRGKRVVFLKQLPSGLLLITGPFKINGVPLRRINQTYVIATTTFVDLKDFKIDPKFDDKYFSKPKREKKKAEPEQLFTQEKEQKKQIDASRITDQKAFDKPIVEIIKKTPNMIEYLGSKFSLKRGQYPHEMNF